jgi:Tfp pilus assembly protein PilZ
MNSPDSEDHRRYERFPFIEEILIDGINKCTSADISEGGLFISTIQRFEKDQLIELVIPVKGEKISLKAQVAYCQPGIGAGLAFIDSDDVLRAKIKELVESVTSKSD